MIRDKNARSKNSAYIDDETGIITVSGSKEQKIKGTVRDTIVRIIDVDLTVMGSGIIDQLDYCLEKATQHDERVGLGFDAAGSENDLKSLPMV